MNMIQNFSAHLLHNGVLTQVVASFHKLATCATIGAFAENDFWQVDATGQLISRLEAPDEHGILVSAGNIHRQLHGRYWDVGEVAQLCELRSGRESDLLA